MKLLYRSIKFTNLLLFFLQMGQALCVYGAEERFKAEISLPEDSATLPNPIAIELTLHYPRDYQPDLETLLSNLLANNTPEVAPFTFISLEKSDPIPNRLESDLLTTTLKIQLEPGREGRWVLTFFNIPFNSVENDRYELFTTPFYVDIALPEASQRAPLDAIMPLLPLNHRMPIELDINLKNALLGDLNRLEIEAHRNEAALKGKAVPWQLLAIVAIAFALFFLLRRKKGAHTDEKIVEVKPSENFSKALTAIEKLKQSPADDHFYEKRREVALQLSLALRAALQQRYNIEIFSLSSEELCSLLERKWGSSAEPLQQLFQSLEQLKFGNFTRPLEEYSAMAAKVKEQLQYIGSEGCEL